MAANNWHKYFTNRLENDGGNRNNAIYLTAWSQQRTNDKKLALLTNDTSMAVFAVDTNNKIIIIHSFWNLSESILNSTKIYGTLIGNGHVASMMIINTTSLLQNVNMAAPTYKSIIACADKAAIEGLNRPPQ